jgi:hypothetical protein
MEGHLQRQWRYVGETICTSGERLCNISRPLFSAL